MFIPLRASSEAGRRRHPHRTGATCLASIKFGLWQLAPGMKPAGSFLFSRFLPQPHRCRFPSASQSTKALGSPPPEGWGVSAPNLDSGIPLGRFGLRRQGPRHPPPAPRGGAGWPSWSYPLAHSAPRSQAEHPLPSPGPHPRAPGCLRPRAPAPPDAGRLRAQPTWLTAGRPARRPGT